MGEYDQIKARIEAGQAQTRELQIELYRLLALHLNDPRAPQLRTRIAEMESVARDLADIERRFRPRASSV
jgi:hypothetical protein